MPTLELHGFGDQASTAFITAARTRLDRLSYRDDIVFDLNRAGGKVVGWDGSDRPFLRICSRVQAKVDELRELLGDLADIETLLIGYFPQRRS